MTTDLATLIDPPSEDELVTSLLASLSAAGFPVTSWSAGSVPRTLNAANAKVMADLYATIEQVARGGFLDLATGTWLTLHAASRFQLTRIAATFAEGTLTLACASGAGPINITAASLVISTASGKQYRSTNTTTVVVPDGGTASITVRAEGSGTTYNLASELLTTIVTPATAGLSFTASAGAAWRTTNARNEETDAELRTRCRDRWATLAVYGCGTREAYRYNLTSAGQNITRVAFATPPGDGTLIIYIAGASGLVSDGERDAAQAYIDDRKPITDDPTVTHAGTTTVDLTGSSVRFKAGYNISANRNAVQAAVRAYIDTLPIGDDIDQPLVDEAGLAAAIYNAVPGGIADVDLTCGDVTVAVGAIAQADETLIAWS